MKGVFSETVNGIVDRSRASPLRPGLLVALLALALSLGCNSPSPLAIPADEDVQVSPEGLGTDPPHTGRRHDLPRVNSMIQNHPPLSGRPQGVRVPAFGLERASGLAPAAFPAGTQVRVGLKLLVLTTSTTDEGYRAVRDMISRVAGPFDTIDTTQTTLKASALETERGEGRYNGIVLTNGDLGVEDGPGNWVSSLSDVEWQVLADYETNYRVRRLTMFAWPDPASNGLDYWDTTESSLEAALTSDGQQVFTDLQSTATIPVRWTRAYLTTPTGKNVRPLLQTPTGETLAAIYSVGARENLTLTMAHSSYTPHTVHLGYGLIRWLTRGVFVGERRMYLSVHVDDLFIWSTQWDADNNRDSTEHYRTTGEDLWSFSNWQNGFRNRYPLFREFVTDMLFNGHGFERSAPATCGLPVPDGADGLSAIAKCPSVKSNLRFVNHTFTHATFEQDTPQAEFENQIGQNIGVATDADALDLPRGWGRGQFDATALVTGSHSGLGDYWWHNPPENLGRSGAAAGLILAAESLGIETIGSGWSSSDNCLSTPVDCNFKNPSHNTGNRFPGTLPSNDILVQPRFPPAITPNVSTPAQVRSYTNTVYNNALTYTQILELDTDDAMTNIGGFWVNAVYFHQANLRKFVRSGGGAGCVMCDWLEKFARKYSAMYRLPITNLSMTPINQVMRDRARYDASSASGMWNKTTGAVTVSSNDAGVRVPVTNSVSGTRYGADRVVKLQNGQTANVGTD